LRRARSLTKLQVMCAMMPRARHTMCADRRTSGAWGPPLNRSNNPHSQDTVENRAALEGRAIRRRCLLGSVPVGGFLDCSVLVRIVGLPGRSCRHFRDNMMLRRRPFTERIPSGDDICRCLAGTMRAISFLCIFDAFGASADALRKPWMVPGLRFSSPDALEKVNVGVG